MKRAHGQSIRYYRLSVAIRCLIAIVGGYTLAVVCNLFLALYLPLPKAEAVIAANMLSIIIFCLLLCCIFSVSTNIKALLVTSLPSVLLFLFVFLYP